MRSVLYKQKSHTFHSIQVVLGCLLLALANISCNPTTETFTLLRVNTLPAGAEVQIDGKPYGVSPIIINDLPPGEHYVILKLEDYQRMTHRFDLIGDTPNQLELTMVRNTGLLSLTTTPSEAEVFIRDLGVEGSEPVLLGKSPVDGIKIETGSYFLAVNKENYEGESRELIVGVGDIHVFDYALKAINGYVQVYSVPTGSQVWVDDELHPTVTPVRIRLSPGDYSIGVHKTGFNIKEGILTVLPNGQHNFDVVLEKGDMPLGMVLIPEGEFVFGDDNKSPDERPRKKETLKAFYMDKYEVTNAEFKKVFSTHTFMKNQDKYPVQGITWKKAHDYALAVGKRLPTEVEWEKAARGFKGSEFPWGALFDSNNANTKEGGNVLAVKTGTYKSGASEFGCFDMSGNVYEWTSTWYNPYEGNPEVSIDYGRVYRVLRGGSYLTDAFESRSARRHYAKPGDHREDFGFRCAKDLTQ